MQSKTIVVHSHNHSNYRNMGNIVKTCITMIIVIIMVRLVTKVIITVCRLSCKKIDGSYGRSGVPRGGVWGVQTPPEILKISAESSIT